MRRDRRNTPSTGVSPRRAVNEQRHTGPQTTGWRAAAWPCGRARPRCTCCNRLVAWRGGVSGGCDFPRCGRSLRPQRAGLWPRASGIVGDHCIRARPTRARSRVCARQGVHVSGNARRRLKGPSQAVAKGEGLPGRRWASWWSWRRWLSVPGEQAGPLAPPSWQSSRAGVWPMGALPLPNLSRVLAALSSPWQTARLPRLTRPS